MNGRGYRFTILICVLIFSSLQITTADSGDIGDPIVAKLGEYTDNLPQRATNIYFSFTTTNDQWYNFSIVGPEWSILICIYKSGSSTQICAAITLLYPDFCEIGDLPGKLLIQIVSINGDGDFTLTISEIEKPPQLELTIDVNSCN